MVVRVLSVSSIVEVLLASGAEPLVASAFPFERWLKVGPSAVSPLSAALLCRTALCPMLWNGVIRLLKKLCLQVVVVCRREVSVRRLRLLCETFYLPVTSL